MTDKHTQSEKPLRYDAKQPAPKPVSWLAATLLFWPIAAGGAALDLWSKWAVFRWLSQTETQEYSIINGFLKFVLRVNDGAAFSLFRGWTFFLIAISVVTLIIVICVFFFGKLSSKLMLFALGCITGGIVGKRYGRVGDSPIVGAGLYADNEGCAVSCTGVGEDFVRTVLAKTLSDLITFKGLNGPTAADQGLDYLVRKVDGRGGFILIDHQGLCAGRFNTRKMAYGWIERGGETCCQI